MRQTPTLTAVALVAGALLVAAFGLATDAADRHPDVDVTITCDDCHREMTPKIVDDWFAGAHGRNGVKCFVCHGTTGDDFVRTPHALRCVGCHAEQVPDDTESTTARCFSCHPGHLLSPHVKPETEPEGGQP